MIDVDVEHSLRIRWYRVQIDSVQPGLNSAEITRIADEKAEVTAEMRGLGIEVPPSINEPEYIMPERATRWEG